ETLRHRLCSHCLQETQPPQRERRMIYGVGTRCNLRIQPDPERGVKVRVQRNGSLVCCRVSTAGGPLLRGSITRICFLTLTEITLRFSARRLTTHLGRRHGHFREAPYLACLCQRSELLLLRRSTATMKPGKRRDSTHAQAACNIRYLGSNDSPFFQRISAMAAILRARVTRASSGFMPWPAGDRRTGVTVRRG